MELKEDQAKFQKYIAFLKQDKLKRKNKHPYQLPENLKDIQSDPAKMPSPDLIKQDLKTLKEEVFLSISYLNILIYIMAITP